MCESAERLATKDELQNLCREVKKNKEDLDAALETMQKESASTKQKKTDNIDELIDEAVSKQIDDFKEKEKRKANVIIYNIKELDEQDEAEDTTTAQDYDQEKGNKFIEEDLKITRAEIRETKRVGKLKKKASSEEKQAVQMQDH